MPHVIVKLYPGRTEEQKLELTARLIKDIKETLGAGDDSISVAIEEVDPEEWGKAVYKPDILDKEDTLYKKPGYKMEP